MNNTKNKRIFLYLPLLLCIVYIAWWAAINFLGWPNRDNYTDSYSLVALLAGVAGLMGAKQWGLFKSRLGATIGYISLGLIFQFLGHFIYALYFRIGHVELAYPSVGDIPFLLTGVAYILALYNLLKLLVVKGSIFRPVFVLITGITCTAILSYLVYVSFLKLGLHDERGSIYSALNVAYPVVQAVYFLLGLVALLQAKRMAGGRMFKAVLVLLVALIIQYVAEFSFLYQSYHNTWQPAGTNDLAYVIAYGLMAFAILMIENVRTGISSPTNGSKEMSSTRKGTS